MTYPAKMTHAKCARRALAVLTCLVLLPAAAFAQSSIAGEVTDNTGGVLPGVTVEATSPALIEGSRVAISDGAGRYTIVNLRPGTYTVTMMLPGFSTFVQESLELQANFTLTVDGQLAVGALEETVTVSGAAPVVDVQSAARTEVLQRDVIDALPTPRNTQSIGYLAQGVRLTRPDVGGSQMMEQVQMISHGANSAHSTMQVDGMIVNAALGDGRIMNYNNQALAQEMAVSTSGSPAEVQAGGIRLNMIPKDGGNTISGSFYGGFTDGAWQADNLDADLRSQGLTSVDGITNIHDVNPSFGGPFIRDRLWYFTSVRAISVDELKLGSIFQETPHTPAELVGQQGVMEQHVRSGLLRLTSQLSQQNKVSAYLDRIFKFKGREFGSNVEPTLAASHRDPNRANYHTFQTKWTSTISSRVLLEVGFSQVQETLLIANQPNKPVTNRSGAGFDLSPRPPSDLMTCIQTPCYHPLSYDQTRAWFRDGVRHQDDNLRTRENGYGLNIWITPDHRWTTSTALSYVTGSHNFKVGMQWGIVGDGRAFEYNAHLVQRYQDGVPDKAQAFNSPQVNATKVHRDLGLYAQDTWTIDRLTINAGVRIDSFGSRNNLNRAGDAIAGGRFIAARRFPEEDVKPFFNDISPRLTLVYDLFGDARTALKVGVNRFVTPIVAGFAGRYHPVRNVGDSRNWFDCALNPAIHGAYTPLGSTADCATGAQLSAAGLSADYLNTNGDNIAQDHEIGLLNNAAIFAATEFAQADRRPEPDIERPWNLEWTGSIQHEIAPRVSIMAAYYRRVFHDIEGIRNVLIQGCDPLTAQAGVPCGSWMPFSVTFDDPVGVLPSMVGTSFLAFNRDPATQGLTDRVDRTSDLMSNIYNGFEVSIQGRLPNGGTLFGGWTAHQHISNTCDLDNPNGIGIAEFIDINRNRIQGGRFCNQSEIGIPFRNDFKMFGAYPLPGDFEVSGSFQAYSGNEREVRWQIPASYYPGGQRTEAREVQLRAPGTDYFEYWTQVDIAIRKIFRIGDIEYSGQMDIYNLMNNNSVLSDNDTYGSALFTPTSVLQGRMMRLALQVKW